MIKDFKFLQQEKKQFKLFHLNVMNDVFGRVPSYPCPFEPYDNNTEDVYGTVSDVINGRLGIVGIFTTLVIQRRGSGVVEINYNNVEGVNELGLIFAREDRVIVRYKRN
jgi:hypothetical protein